MEKKDLKNSSTFVQLWVLGKRVCACHQSRYLSAVSRSQWEEGKRGSPPGAKNVNKMTKRTSTFEVADRKGMGKMTTSGERVCKPTEASIPGEPENIIEKVCVCERNHWDKWVMTLMNSMEKWLLSFASYADSSEKQKLPRLCFIRVDSLQKLTKSPPFM